MKGKLKMMEIKYGKLVAAAALAGLAVIAKAGPEGRSSVSIPVTELHYIKTGITDGVHGELQAAPAYGDLANGAHGTFIKMPAGFVTPAHTHTADYYAVVISGTGVNIPVGGTDLPLPSGSYWFQKGTERHITKCISSNDCIFFLNQSAKFDFIADAPAPKN
jgi:hypothetical protein